MSDGKKDKAQLELEDVIKNRPEMIDRTADDTGSLDSNDPERRFLYYHSFSDVRAKIERYSTSDFDKEGYPLWRENRIKKLVEIVGGESWFKGKSVLELACGFGHIGAALKEMGAEVTFAEGREEYFKFIKDHAKDSKVLLIDQDQPNRWELDQTFDLVIHWGVLYHLEFWKRDLIRALKFGKQVCLETEVIDSYDPHAVIHRREAAGFDQAIYGLGCFPSPAHIERILEENDATFVRYDDKELDSDYHNYSWKATGTDDSEHKPGRRRFWMIKTNLDSCDMKGTKK